MLPARTANVAAIVNMDLCQLSPLARKLASELGSAFPQRLVARLVDGLEQIIENTLLPRENVD